MEPREKDGVSAHLSSLLPVLAQLSPGCSWLASSLCSLPFALCCKHWGVAAHKLGSAKTWRRCDRRELKSQ